MDTSTTSGIWQRASPHARPFDASNGNSAKRLWRAMSDDFEQRLAMPLSA